MAELPSTSSFFDRQLASLRASRTTWSFALILSVIALGSRLWAIADKSLWLDEALSWRAAHMSLSHMVDYTGAADNHPPLYYGVLHFWVKVFGDSEFGMRSLSAIAGAAAIILLVMVCWRMREPLLAVAVAILLPLNSTQLYFSQEARMYGLMSLFAVSASIALGALIKKPSLLRTAAYTLLLTCVVYTHYSGFVLVGAQAAIIAGYGGYALWQRKPNVLLAGGVAFAAMAVAYIPWYSHLRQTTSVGVSDVPALTYNLLLATSRGAFGISRQGDIWLIPIAAVLGMGAVGIARRWRNPMFAALGSLALVPAGQLLVSLHSKPIFDLRQIAPYVPGLTFVLALGCVDAMALLGRGKTAVRLAGGLAVTAIGVVLLSFMFQGLADTYTGEPIENWRGAAADLKDFDGPIFISATYAVVPFEYYYGMTSNVQSFGLWSPEALPAGQTAMIGISHQSEQSVLTALGSNINIEGHRVYRGVTFYEARVLHHTALNVDVPLDQADAGWSVDARGYLQTGRDFSSFTCTCVLDANGDGRADEPFTVVIEYFDAGTAPFRLFGPTASAVLASQPMSNTMQWQAANVALPAGTPVGQTFGLSGGVTLRRLQVIRTQLENVDLFGSYQGGTRWILRADGYIQSTDGYSYIDASLPLDADSNGVVDRAFRIDLEYKASGTQALQIFGLRSGEKFAPELLQSTEKHATTGWRAASVEVPQGAHLQTRVYIGRGVTLRSVRITPIDTPAGGG